MSNGTCRFTSAMNRLPSGKSLKHWSLTIPDCLTRSFSCVIPINFVMALDYALPLPSECEPCGLVAIRMCLLGSFSEERVGHRIGPWESPSYEKYEYCARSCPTGKSTATGGCPKRVAPHLPVWAERDRWAKAVDYEVTPASPTRCVIRDYRHFYVADAF